MSNTEATMTETKTSGAIHPFEASGLGKAPFRFLYAQREVGPVTLKDGSQVGAPGQPMGCCAHCYTGIAECCYIRSADGKVFVVGNVCVNKTADSKLIDPAKRAINKIKREARHASEAARIEAVRVLMNGSSPERDAVVAKLSALPHPVKYRAENGSTLLDWAEWMFRNAGTTGKVKAARLIERAAKGE